MKSGKDWERKGKGCQGHAEVMQVRMKAKERETTTH